MSFIPITTNKGARPPAPPRIRLYVVQRTASLSFHLTRALVDRLVWNAGDRILVMLGIGEDAGKATLVRVRGRSGRKLASYPIGKSGFVVSCSIPHRVGALTRADIMAGLVNATDLEFIVVDDQLRIVLPLHKKASRELAKVAA
jgi:hypothetical protein